jgi:hypothetical protein
MWEENRSMNDEIFDLILTQALREDCAREVALYKNMPDDHEFSEKFEKRAKSISKRLKRKEKVVKFRKAAPKLATAAAVAVVVTALATNPAVAAFFGNIYARITGEHVQHEFESTVDVTPETFNHELRPTFLPQGYRIQSAWYGIGSVAVEYVDEEYNMIIFEYAIAGWRAAFINYEHSIQHIVSVNGREAFFYESTDEDFLSALVWYNRGYAFVLFAQISLEEFVQIAESIKIP